MLDFLGPDPSQTGEQSTNATLSPLSRNIDGITDRVVSDRTIMGGVIPAIENLENLIGNADDNLILGMSEIAPQSCEDLGLENDRSTSSIDALTGENLSNSNSSNLPISQIVEEAVRSAHTYLSGLAIDPDFSDNMNLAFGNSWDSDVASNLVQKFASSNFNEIPAIEILPSAAINGANGAFAKLTNTIYLAKEFVEQNAGNPGAITSVLLEETGHFIDSKINVSDAAGDEGDIFARLVQGKTISAGEILDLKGEDDTSVLTLNGQVFWIEQSANKKADFNGDGKTDFIRQEKGGWDDDTNNTANVYLSNGNGTFWKQDLTNQADMKGDDGVNIIIGDFNGDKKTDFIRQEKGGWDDDTNNTANVYLSNGNGTFWKQDLTNQADMKGDTTNLIVGDFNGDGKDDFIRQEKGGWDDDTNNTANVYISNGNGTFWKQDLTNQADMKGDTTNLIIGDFNGDGKDDFIRQEKGGWDDDTNNTANIYLSNGNGTFWKQDLTNQADMKGDFTNLILGDFNGDKKTDFIRQEKGDWDNDGNNTANVYLSNGNGTFSRQDLTNQADMQGDLTNLIVGDYNGDGKDDFIRQEKGSWDDDTNNTANVYLSNGNGTFWKQDLTNQADMKGDLTNLIVGDFNGDKKTDFIRQEKSDWDNDDNNTANVYLSNGNGTFWKQDLTNWREMKGDLSNIITTSPKLLPGHLTGDIENKGLSFLQDWSDKYFNNGVNLYRYDSSGRTYQGIESNKDTILVIHGRGSKSEDGNIKSLATAVANKYSNQQVLALDWQAPAQDPALLAPYDAARSITPVAEWAVNTLKTLGIDPKQISLLGHSLGSYVSAEIGRIFGKVKSIVALDPAYPGGNYDLNGNQPDDQNARDFRDVADKSLAFVVSDEYGFFKGSSAGDAPRAATARNSFVVRFSNYNGNNEDLDFHNGVVNVYKNLLSNYVAPSVTQNQYDNSGNNSSTNQQEGIITATQNGSDWSVTGRFYVSGSEQISWM